MKEDQAMRDIRWKQRFNNYLKAFQTLVVAVELARSFDELFQRADMEHPPFTRLRKPLLARRARASPKPSSPRRSTTPPRRQRC